MCKIELNVILVLLNILGVSITGLKLWVRYKVDPVGSSEAWGLNGHFMSCGAHDGTNKHVARQHCTLIFK